MMKDIFWIFQLNIKDGQINNLEKIKNELVNVTKENEPGTLGYHWAVNDDKTVCQIYEWYADCDAALIHLKTFVKKYAASLIATGDKTSFTVYGTPSGELKALLDLLGATYMSPLGGFTR